MNDIAQIGLFLGYAGQTKGYRINDVHSGKIYVSRDVRFDEQTCWDWEKKQVKIKKIEEGQLLSNLYRVQVILFNMNKATVILIQILLLILLPRKQSHLLKFMRDAT